MRIEKQKRGDWIIITVKQQTNKYQDPAKFIEQLRKLIVTKSLYDPIFRGKVFMISSWTEEFFQTISIAIAKHGHESEILAIIKEKAQQFLKSSKTTELIVNTGLSPKEVITKRNRYNYDLGDTHDVLMACFLSRLHKCILPIVPYLLRKRLICSYVDANLYCKDACKMRKLCCLECPYFYLWGTCEPDEEFMGCMFAENFIKLLFGIGDEDD